MQLGRLLVVATSIAALPSVPCGQPVDASAQRVRSQSQGLEDPSEWRNIALNRALDAAGGIEDAYRRAEAFASIARAQTLVSDSAADRAIHQALAAARQIADPAFRGWALHDVVRAQIAADDPHGARLTASSIEARRPHGAALAAIAEVQVRGGNLAGARETASRIREAGTKGEVLRQIVAIHTARGELAEARSILRDIKDAFQNALAAGDIAVTEVRGGHVDRANALAARVRRAHRAQVYGRIALARVHAGDLPGAMDTLQKIDDELHRAIVQGRIAATRAVAGEAREARQLFASAIAAVDRHSNEPEQSAITLAQLARMQAASADRSAAMETLGRAMQAALRLGPGEQREEALDYIARSQARAADAAGAIETALQMRDRVARALVVRDVVTLQSHATSASASQSAARFQDPLIEAAAQFGVLGVQLLQSGQAVSGETIDAAREAVRKVDDVQLRPAAFAALAAARASTGAIEAGYSIFREALAAADAIAGSERQAAAYVDIVGALNNRLVFLGQPASSDADKKSE